MCDGPRFEILDHTADVRVRLKGMDPADLLASGARALAYLLTGSDALDPVEEVALTGQAEDLEELLVDLLNELIFLYETRSLVFPQLLVKHLNFPFFHVVVRGASVEPSDREPVAAVKAATHSGLRVVRKAQGCLMGEVIFDL